MSEQVPCHENLPPDHLQVSEQCVITTHTQKLIRDLYALISGDFLENTSIRVLMSWNEGGTEFIQGESFSAPDTPRGKPYRITILGPKGEMLAGKRLNALDGWLQTYARHDIAAALEENPTTNLEAKGEKIEEISDRYHLSETFDRDDLWKRLIESGKQFYDSQFGVLISSEDKTQRFEISDEETAHELRDMDPTSKSIWLTIIGPGEKLVRAAKIIELVIQAQ